MPEPNNLSKIEEAIRRWKLRALEEADLIRRLKESQKEIEEVPMPPTQDD